MVRDHSKSFQNEGSAGDSEARADRDSKWRLSIDPVQIVISFGVLKGAGLLAQAPSGYIPAYGKGGNRSTRLKHTSGCE